MNIYHAQSDERLRNVIARHEATKSDIRHPKWIDLAYKIPFYD